jgi:hypothetical protein
MNGIDFEGYTGTELSNFSFSEDMMLVIVLLLLTAFAWIFRQNFPLFSKMISDINAGQRRQSIFETTQKDGFLLRMYMSFQTHLLLSIFLFTVAVEYNFISRLDITSTLLVISILLLALYVMHLFKRSLYGVFDFVFVDKQARKTVFLNYQSLFSVWGILLYIPVLWILLIDKLFFGAIIFVIISYITLLLIHSLRSVYIFFNKNSGFLFISLYLCAQELVPILFFYEGLNYTYNIIEAHNLWQ